LMSTSTKTNRPQTSCGSCAKLSVVSARSKCFT
jgi:hypothetical protein